MNAEYFRALFDYQYWARDRLFLAVDRLSESDYLAARPMDYGSIHGTLVHTYGGELVWYTRWMGESPNRLMNPSDVPTLAELKTRWADLEKQVQAFVGGLSEEEMASRVLEYRSTEGQPFKRMLWETMAHLVNHGTNHRSEVAAAATQLGCSPGDLDMIRYFNR
ncbi:MAG TPA: DinB family protein [Chloroflexota bacterium]